jgi:hypothetical protein
MLRPVLAGAVSRAHLRATVLAVSTTLLVTLSVAGAQEARIFPCGPIDRAGDMAKAMGGEALVTLSDEQFQFVRGLFVMAPDTPSSLPPGDRAAMSMRADGSASIVFLDGDQACAPMKLGKEGVDILMQVGRGEVVHSGHGL